MEMPEKNSRFAEWFERYRLFEIESTQKCDAFNAKRDSPRPVKDGLG